MKDERNTDEGGADIRMKGEDGERMKGGVSRMNEDLWIPSPIILDPFILHTFFPVSSTKRSISERVLNTLGERRIVFRP